MLTETTERIFSLSELHQLISAKPSSLLSQARLLHSYLKHVISALHEVGLIAFAQLLDCIQQVCIPILDRSPLTENIRKIYATFIRVMQLWKGLFDRAYTEINCRRN